MTTVQFYVSVLSTVVEDRDCLERPGDLLVLRLDFLAWISCPNPSTFDFRAMSTSLPHHLFVSRVAVGMVKSPRACGGCLGVKRR